MVMMTMGLVHLCCYCCMQYSSRRRQVWEYQKHAWTPDQCIPLHLLALARR